LKVFARADLVPANLPPDVPALLCEGSWPECSPAGSRYSLDDAIDVRFAWVDREAARLAECAAEQHRTDSSALFAWLNALSLRYELVKYVRVLAFFEQCYRPHRREALELHLTRGRDETYAALFRELCRSYRLSRVERWHDAHHRQDLSFPVNRSWRRTIARMTQRSIHSKFEEGADRPRIVLCGNPRVLDPVCEELLGRGAQLWWLYDRFAVRSFARWRLRGVQQLVCDSDLGRANVFSEPKLTARLACRGIDLGATVAHWLAERARTHGARQTRLLAEAERRLRTIQPDVILCDEDATPLPRVAIHTTREFGTRSYVVQHGAPCIRFGFSPPAADHLFVWGESSRQQLAQWGVARERIIISGTTTVFPSLPREGEVRGTSERHETRNQITQVVLLATVPPHDHRPDAVEYHLTTKTHRDMLEAACQIVSQLPHSRLTIKLHPRTRDAGSIQAALAAHPTLEARIVRGGNLARLVDRADLVLSCASSAGVEAAARGVPVIQLLPAGSIDLLPTDAWGFQGTARGLAELEALVQAVLHGKRIPSNVSAFAANCPVAAHRIADTVLSQIPARSQEQQDDVAAGEFILAGASPWPLS